MYSNYDEGHHEDSHYSLEHFGKDRGIHDAAAKQTENPTDRASRTIFNDMMHR